MLDPFTGFPNFEIWTTPYTWAQIELLKIAAKGGFLDEYVKKIRNKKDKNPQDAKGNTPLHFAAENGQIEMVQFIMNNVDNKNPVNNSGETPLHWAARNGQRNICKIILQEFEITENSWEKLLTISEPMIDAILFTFLCN